MHKSRRVIGILLSIFLFSGCVQKDADTLMEVMKRHGIETIYIEENGRYIPFLIIDIHNDGILLLREHVKCDQPYSYAESESSYYADSALDKYLSDSYLKEFPEYIQKLIPTSCIQITADNSIGVCGRETEYIDRKVFILSWTEVTGQSNSTGLKEGTQIRTLKARSLLSATNDYGEETSWWLRTPNTWYWHLVFVVNSDGGINTQTTLDGFGPHKCGVRPAFFISGKARIAYENGKWYVVKQTTLEE